MTNLKKYYYCTVVSDLSTRSGLPNGEDIAQISASTPTIGDSFGFTMLVRDLPNGSNPFLMTNYDVNGALESIYEPIID
ncbi:MAG: hypothetical protein AABX66_00735 [Nanoarchaeota archaeon]